MAIPEGYKANFETIRKAAGGDHLALVECEYVGGDSETVYVICAVVLEGEEYVITPLAKMFDGNPYEEVRMKLEEEDDEIV